MLRVYFTHWKRRVTPWGTAASDVQLGEAGRNTKSLQLQGFARNWGQVSPSTILGSAFLLASGCWSCGGPTPQRPPLAPGCRLLPNFPGGHNVQTGTLRLYLQGCITPNPPSIKDSCLDAGNGWGGRQGRPNPPQLGWVEEVVGVLGMEGSHATAWPLRHRGSTHWPGQF